MFVPFSASEPPIKILAGPPEATAPHVLAFCKRINPDVTPIRLTIRPEPGCLPRECFLNVQQKVKRDGGSILYGWALWEWPRVFIEAEHHAVHEAPDGTLTDVTPSMAEDPQVARLFLPDSTATYDFESDGTNRDNIRQALTPDAQIEEYLKLAAELAAITMSTPGTGMVTISDPVIVSRIQAIMKRNAHLKREIAQRYTSQGAPCYCGSGQKFKRCHGQPRKGKL